MSSKPQQVCRECGQVIHGSAVIGQCPACLMKAAMCPRESRVDGGAARNLDLTIGDLGKAFPELEVMECLGKGGMAAVYKSRHRALERLLALKILLVDPLDDPIVADRFAAEGDILKGIDHPHVIRAYAGGERAGFLYLLLELVQGPSLREVVQAGPIPPLTGIYAGIQIANGLSFVHQRGYIHRDIKPDNILLHAGSEPFEQSLASFMTAGGRLRVADFGLATVVAEKPGSRHLTLPYHRLGTLDYMAPECRNGGSRPDARIDIYSMGVLLYELLTGDLPVGRFAPPSKRVDVIREVDEIVLRCLEPDPKRRYSDADELRGQLTLAMAEMQRKRGWPWAAFKWR